MMGFLFTESLLVGHSISRGSIVIHEAFRSSANREGIRMRTALDIETAILNPNECSVWIQLYNSGSEPILPLSEMEILLSFPNGMNLPRRLPFRSVVEGFSSDTWSVDVDSIAGDVPVILHPGSTIPLQVAMNLTQPGDTDLFIVIATPNGITDTAQLSGLSTPCLATP